jgi:hypothetical protein
MDVMQDGAGLMLRWIPTTGTHLDLYKKAMGVFADAPREGDLFDRARAVLKGFEAAVEGAKKGGSARLLARKCLPLSLWPLVAVHTLVLVGTIVYPYVVPAKRGWDVYFIVYILAVFLHWCMLCGECVLSYIEKKLFYESYELGTAPHLQWFVDNASWQLTLVIAVVGTVGVTISFWVVVWRQFAPLIRRFIATRIR